MGCPTRKSKGSQAWKLKNETYHRKVEKKTYAKCRTNELDPIEDIAFHRIYIRIIESEECVATIYSGKGTYLTQAYVVRDHEPIGFFGILVGEPTLPLEYSDYVDVFLEVDASHLPTHGDHDYMILELTKRCR